MSQGLGTGTVVAQLVAERPRIEKLWRAARERKSIWQWLNSSDKTPQWILVQRSPLAKSLNDFFSYFGALSNLKLPVRKSWKKVQRILAETPYWCDLKCAVQGKHPAKVSLTGISAFWHLLHKSFHVCSSQYCPFIMLQIVLIILPYAPIKILSWLFSQTLLLPSIFFFLFNYIL